MIVDGKPAYLSGIVYRGEQEELYYRFLPTAGVKISPGVIEDLADEMAGVNLVEKGKKPKEPKREDYTLRRDLMEEIVKMFGGASDAWFDLFATETTARFENFASDAYQLDWSEIGRVYWANPPFSQWGKVFEGIVRAKGRFICLIPDWGQPWIVTALQLASRKMYIPSGVSLFEGPLEGKNKKLPPTKWGCWLIEIPPSPRVSCPESEAFKQIEILPWNRSKEQSVGRRRRERAKEVRRRLKQCE